MGVYILPDDEDISHRQNGAIACDAYCIMCDKRGHKGKACENLKRILPADMLNKCWPGHDNPPSDDQVGGLRKELIEAKRAKDESSRGRGGNRGRGGSTRGSLQVSFKSAPLAKKRRLDDDGDCTVLLTERPDYPDSEPHLAFKQAQARKKLAWQQQKDEEDRIAGENAPTREEELEQRVSDLKQILEKYQADAIISSTKNCEMEARIFEAESRRETLEETLSTFRRRQKEFNEEANKRLKSFTERNKVLEAEKQQAASQYGTVSMENQFLKAEIIRFNVEIASLRNKEAGHNFTGAWDNDEDIV